VETEKIVETEESSVYSINEKECAESGYFKTNFTIQYFSKYINAFPDNGDEHLISKNIKNDIVLEEMSIGVSNISLSSESFSIRLLKSLGESLEDQLIGFDLISVDEAFINDKKCYAIKAIGDYSGFEENGYFGKYKIMFILPIPEKNDAITAVLIGMLAHENSEINNFEDFETKGMIGEMFSTFQYNY
jgi:hypothetical protein